MILKKKEKEEAINLRSRGYSLSEISKKLDVSSSTVSVWTRSVVLNKKAKERISCLKIKAVEKARLINHKKALARFDNCSKWVIDVFRKQKLQTFDYQMICALLYWGEGAKFSDRVEFTNSDPEMVKVFLISLENGYGVTRKKIKVNLHLHQYHNEKKQKKFWSDLLEISEEQFNKTFWKKNSLKVKRDNYLGCIRICYNSKEIVDKIKVFYKQLSKLIGP